MVDLAKYENLIGELGAIESRVEILKNKFSDTKDRNSELEISIEETNQQKRELQQKISRLETEMESLKGEVENSLFKTLTSEERESLKVKIKGLISKLDNYISS